MARSTTLTGESAGVWSSQRKLRVWKTVPRARGTWWPPSSDHKPSVKRYGRSVGLSLPLLRWVLRTHRSALVLAMAVMCCIMTYHGYFLCFVCLLLVVLRVVRSRSRCAFVASCAACFWLGGHGAGGVGRLFLPRRFHLFSYYTVFSEYRSPVCTVYWIRIRVGGGEDGNV